MCPDPANKRPAAFWEALHLGALLSFADLVLLQFWILKSAGLTPMHVDRGETLTGISPGDLPSPMLISIAASSALALLCSQYPALLFRSRWILPAAIVAPAVHAALCILTAALGTTAPIGIQKAPDPLQPALLWLVPINLALSVAVQFAMLAVWDGIRRGVASFRS